MAFLIGADRKLRNVTVHRALGHVETVPDAVNIPLITATERGAGGGHIRAELAKHGIAPRMDGAYAKEMAELGVKTA
jgi:hypothetical protein